MTFENLSAESLQGLLGALTSLESSPVIILDSEERIIHFNPTCEELTGYSAGEVKGKEFIYLLPKEDKEETFLSKAAKEVISKQLTLITKEGEKVGINWKICCSRDKSKKGFFVFRGEPQPLNRNGDSFSLQRGSDTQETQKKYQTMFEYAYDAIFLSRFDNGRIFEVNPEAEHLLGYNHDELLGKNLSELFGPQDFSDLKKRLTKNKFHYWKDKQLVTKEGNKIVVSTSSSFIEYRGKKTILSLLQDVTKRIELEEQLRKKADNLKESNQQLENMIQVISHDLKEPIRTIGNYSDILFSEYREKLGGQSFIRLTKIKENASRLGKMIDELSTITQITFNTKITEVEIPNLVEEIKKELVFDRKKAKIEVQSDFPKIEFNKYQMKVLLRNLISNALKYNSPPQKIEIGYDEKSVDSPLVVFVRDNGEGIAPEYQERVFKMFEQLEPDNNQNGMGAGLAFCKRIVQHNGENIFLDSEVGKGSFFYFTISRSKLK